MAPAKARAVSERVLRLANPEKVDKSVFPSGLICSDKNSRGYSGITDVRGDPQKSVADVLYETGAATRASLASAACTLPELPNSAW